MHNRWLTQTETCFNSHILFPLSSSHSCCLEMQFTHACMQLQIACMQLQIACMQLQIACMQILFEYMQRWTTHKQRVLFVYMHVHLTVSTSCMHFLERSFPNLWSSSLPSGRAIKLKLVVIKKCFLLYLESSRILLLLVLGTGKG